MGATSESRMPRHVARPPGMRAAAAMPPLFDASSSFFVLYIRCRKMHERANAKA